MKLAEIHKRIFERLGIGSLNAMQMATSEFSLPGKLMLLAPTGSGKTIAFLIPLLRGLEAPDNRVQAVVLAPSRELVLQIAEVLRSLLSGDYKSVAFYGGHPFQEEQRSISGGVPDIIVATPGRLLDHLTRKTLTLDRARILVFDEFDKSLELGFQDEMKRIVRDMKNVKTLILTSATEMKDIPGFVDIKGLKTLNFTKDGDAAPVPKLKVHSVASDKKDKLEGLDSLLRYINHESKEDFPKTIVFVNHRESAERVSNYLKTKGYPVTVYHGGNDQNDREKAVATFTAGSTPLMVATDLAARGLDIENVGAIVHYHLPLESETWTHRNGRTARMGADGDVYVLLSPDEDTPEFVDVELTDAIEIPTFEEFDIPKSNIATLHIKAGRKDKISKGDIAGYFMKQGGLTSDELGTIDLKDHQAYVAVPVAKANSLVKTLGPIKLKNKRVRITKVL